MTNKKVRLNLLIKETLKKEISECRKKHCFNASEICRKALKKEIDKLKKNTL